jgi:mRNA-degrading endonuclease toxin of MazEF toxin-antitoxin module
VDDDDVVLPAAENRVMHESRLFLVLSDYDYNNDDTWDIVIGCPLSSSPDFVTALCVPLSAATDSVYVNCWVRVAALQPLAKSDLGTHVGTVPLLKLEQIRKSLVIYLGLRS